MKNRITTPWLTVHMACLLLKAVVGWKPTPQKISVIYIEREQEWESESRSACAQERDYPGFTLNANKHVCVRGRQGEIWRTHRRGRVNVAVEAVWCGHEPQNASSHQKLEDARTGLSSRTRRKHGPTNTLISTHWGWLWTSALQNQKN